MKWALGGLIVVCAMATGCTSQSSAEPATLPPATTTSTTTSTTSSTTTTTTTTTTLPPSQFSTALYDPPRPAALAWTDERPLASRIVVGDDWVALAVYSDGRRRDSVVDLATGEERWTQVSIDAVGDGSERTDPDRLDAPLVIGDTFIHVERFGQSDGGLLQGLDVRSGEVRWSLQQPQWFPAAPYQCGEHVCATTWAAFDGPSRMIEVDVNDGQIIAQGPAGQTAITRDVFLVGGGESTGDTVPYPLPPATIPDDLTSATVAPTTPTTTAPTAPATTPPPTTPPPTPPATTTTVAPTTTAAPTTTTTTLPTFTTGSVAVAPATDRVQTVALRGPRSLTAQPGLSVGAADSSPAQTIVRFDTSGKRLWELPLAEVAPSPGPVGVPTARLSTGSNVLVFSVINSEARPDLDSMVGVDYDSGKVLWTAQNSSTNCWQRFVRPTNVRCHVTGLLQTEPSGDDEIRLFAATGIKVEFEVFDPLTGDGLGSVTAAYPDWDGTGERPAVPSMLWYISGGLAVQSGDKLVALSLADGETIELAQPVVGWCEQGPVDNDGEIYPGFYPCAVGDAERVRVDDKVPAVPPLVGGGDDKNAAFATDGKATGVQLSP